MEDLPALQVPKTNFTNPKYPGTALYYKSSREAPKRKITSSRKRNNNANNNLVLQPRVTRTISRRLVANGLHSCRPLRRLPLTPPNRRQRLEWCRARSTWMTEWHRVVFSDESRFCLSSDSRRVRVWRRRGERSKPAAIVERPTVRQRGLMVWGAIAYDSRSPLLRIQGTMTAQRYVDDVLRPVTLPYLQGVPNALYQQDNARPHTARISQQALQDVQMLPWPPYSPDLSPIEHVWDIIGRRLHALPQPRSEDELWQMSSEPLSSKKETSIIPKIKPPPYYRRKRQLPAEKTSWDEPIESDIKSNWNKFQTQLSCLKEIKIPRYLNSSSSEIEELQLHGFCDASLIAYSAVFYLKTRFKIQKIKINLITSKTKVAPLKTITIPRLELSAALLLAQLNQVILESFPFQPDKTFLWTDSQICIDWIRSDASRWKAFVSNRVSSIQNLTQITDWFHVSSQDNPADCASRGIMPQDLVNHRIWWRGHIWLQENNVRYIPSSPTQVNLNIIQEEVGEGQVLDQTTLIQNSETMLNLEFIERYSTMTKLIRITAWCWRFYYNCLLFDPIRQKGPLTTRELSKAIQVLVKSIQQVEFCTEIKLLKSNKQLPLSNKLTSLNPFLDTQGLLRVGGRLKYSYLNENQNFPLLQPKPPRQESLIKILLTENADIPEAIDENQEDSSILETTFVIEDEESNKDIGTPKIEISEVSVIDKSEGKYSKEPVVSAEALDKKELCHDDSAHLNVVEADLNRPKEATSGIINVYTEANESSSKKKVVPVEIVDTSTKDYLQSGEKAKLSRWKPIDSLCLEDVKESEDDDENYSSSAYIEWPEILKKEVLRPEALEKAVNLEDFEKAAESRQLSKEHLEESTEQGSCIKAESKPWEDPIESGLAAAESDNPAVPERELANESENLIQDSPQSDTQRWKLIPLPFKQ
ncbi:hypothetical protein LAZ67_5004158 [Cordylochernes scorpioides]|uniref:Tc1-like transposase DDE domain-containing protein n=1 Tax=Cordylochernes scorpioides TaxID=51811 RepID=A0ABY6KIR5_9ARAC|nr:hypothetical protein LAZ67_5004158 [Cordylochernes scorpioides]